MMHSKAYLTAFLQEFADVLQVLETDVPQLRVGEGNRPTLERTFRAVHTLKGSALTIGVESAGRLAHQMENVLERLLDGSLAVTTPLVEVLLESVQRLRTIADGFGGGLAVRCANTTELAHANLDSGNSEMDVTLQKLQDLCPSANAGQHLVQSQIVAVPRSPLMGLNPLQFAEIEQARASGMHIYVVSVQLQPQTVMRTARHLVIYQALTERFRVLSGEPQLTLGEDSLCVEHVVVMSATSTANIASAELQQFLRGLADVERIGVELVDVERLQPYDEHVAATLQSLLGRLSAEVGKEIEFACEGFADGKLAVSWSLLGPLLIPLVTNAALHGIETPDERERSGKPRKGHVVVRGVCEQQHLAIEVSDDGRGIGLEQVRRTALNKGIVDSADEQRMSDEQLLRLMFRQGLSTSAEVTAWAGRGIGLDLVHSQITAWGGTIDVKSIVGAGTMFRIHLPIAVIS
jgi:two-component system chemotaxis sensor kinase CheA